uniref:Uncharacterized protein n=1 Tax=Anguilla anguilla TaxID=7936 RepID=A0A0E9QVW0_ANGAN
MFLFQFDFLLVDYFFNHKGFYRSCGSTADPIARDAC